jgi:hypothetical protein
VSVHRRLDELKRSSRPPVVVHQMGKVGSSSVVAAVRAADPDRPVFQVHHLLPASIADQEALYRSTFSSRRRIDGHLVDSIVVRRALAEGRLSDGTVVVTMVRDPMAQRYSAFFQTLSFRMPDLDERLRTQRPSELANDVLAQFNGPGWWHKDRIGAFFREEFVLAWGIDVFATPFDARRGWRHYPGDFPALLIRFEDLSAGGIVALSATVNEKLELPLLQESAKKPYAELMSNVRSRLELSRAYLDRTYESDAVRHFYSDEQLRGFRELWSG